MEEKKTYLHVHVRRCRILTPDYCSHWVVSWVNLRVGYFSEIRRRVRAEETNSSSIVKRKTWSASSTECSCSHFQIFNVLEASKTFQQQQPLSGLRPQSRHNPRPISLEDGDIHALPRFISPGLPRRPQRFDLIPYLREGQHARGAKVTVRLEATDDDTGSIVRLSRGTALTRKVDSRDAEGEQLGTWVRQAVCAKVDGYFRYGQITGYPDSNLVINTKSGPVEATSGDICDSVYPVVAMIMGCHEFPLRSWSYSQLDKIHDTIMERLPNPTSSALTISVAQLLHELLPDVSPAYDCMYSWIDPSTGRRSRVSLQHVINYVYYIDGGKRVPADMQTSFGTSFCELNPCQPAATGAGTSTASQIDDRPTTAAPNTSSFFDMTAVDDDVENAADEAVLAQALLSNGSNCPVNSESTVPVNRSQQPQLDHVGLALGQPRQIDSIANPAPPTVPSRMETETSADLEILDVVRMHKPHLLPYLLVSRRMSVTGATRSAEELEEKGPTKRSKFSFTPTPEQRRVHDIVASDAYKGKSPACYMDSIVSNADLLLWAYPGVAMRAYDLQFGSRGLSFLHFTPVDQLLRLKRQRENFVNMSDFSVSAKFLPAPDPASWDDILAGATGFQQYCAVMCDAVTQQLAITLYNFLGALKSRKLWSQDMLLTLVLWIDSQLEQYRNAVATDSAKETASRNLNCSQFTPDNLERHGLLLTAPTRKDGGNDAVVYQYPGSLG